MTTTTRLRTLAGTLLCALAAVPAPAAAAPGSDTTIEAAQFTLGTGQGGGATATCPVGTRAVGGGVDTTGPTPTGDAGNYVVVVNGPDGWAELTDGAVVRSWFAYVYNGGAQHDFKVYALCSASSDATAEVEPLYLTTQRAGAKSVDCPAGARVVGGGVSTGRVPAGGIPFRIRASGPVAGATNGTSDGEAARSWSAHVFNNRPTPPGNAGETWFFRVTALCSRTADAVLEEEPVTVAGGNAGVATASCPTGRRVMGGGLIRSAASEPANDAPASTTVMMSGPRDETGRPADTDTGDIARAWFGYVFNASNVEQTFVVSALCARDEVTPGGPPGGGGGGQGGGGRQQGGGGGQQGGGGGGGGGPTGGTVRRCAGKRATIVGTNRSETLRGTRGADVIVALGGNDRVLAGRGNDLVCGGAGNDELRGERGNDRMIGAAGRDSLNGGDGNDALDGGGGRDRLDGQGGRDQCLGGADKDRATCERKKGI